MLTRPKWLDCFHLEIQPPQTLFLIAEDRHVALAGRAYPIMGPLLTGEYTLTEIVQQVTPHLSAPEVMYTLTSLERRGLIIEGDAPALPSEQAAYWQLFGVTAEHAARQLQQTRIAIHTVGQTDAEALRASLLGAGIAIDQANPTLRVVVTDHYLDPALAEFNQQARDTGVPWLLIRPAGPSWWVGPLFEPATTGCWECLAERMRTNRQLETYLAHRTNTPEPFRLPLAATDASTMAALQWAATQIAHLVVAPARSRLSGRLLTVAFTTLGIEEHVLTRRPQCRVCGDPSLAQPAPGIQLRDQHAHHRMDGGYRVRTPAETLAHYQHHISPITGVIQWLGDTTDGDTSGLVYSYAAGHNFAMIQDDMYWLQRNLRSSTGGKGMTDIQARVSAIGEAIERYSGVYRGDEPSRIASARELGDQAVDMRQCVQFSDAQFAGRDAWNARTDVGRFHMVPRPFDDAQPIAWSALWSLTDERVKYVPSSYCYFGHPEARQFFFCTSDGNGNAAGNTLEEAILQGFFELVERDSTAIWWYNRIPRPAVDLASFDVPYIAALQAHYQTLNRSLWVLDITADLGITTFVAVSRREDGPTEDILLGLGCHLDPQIALLRALTELNQFLPAVSKRLPDGRTRYNFPEGEAITWWTQARLAEQPYLAPDPNQPMRTVADYPSRASDNIADTLVTCLSIVKEAGLELLVLDQTRPDIGMPVCRVVVPGLRHFWRRLGPGRLYDVPVNLGWRTNPVAEDDLNPYSIFF